MRAPLLAAALVLGVAFSAPVPAVSAEPTGSAPIVLDTRTLDRVTAAGELRLGNGPAPAVVTDPPRRPRDLLPWLRRKIGCALPGRVCTQG
ncbi:MAG: hypothetical protein WHV64_13215 [Geminicoccaceae bacterium]